MKRDEIKNRLLNDPFFALNAVLENNLEEVQQNLIAAGLTTDVLDRDQAFKLISELMTKGKTRDALKAINVKFIPGRLPSGYDEVIAEINPIAADRISRSPVPESVKLKFK